MPQGVNANFLQHDDLGLLTELFNTRVRVNPFKNPPFSAFAHLVQSPPQFLHDFLDVIRFSKGLLEQDAAPVTVEIPFVGGYSSDFRGIFNETPRTRIGFTTLWTYRGTETLALPIVWNYKSNQVDVAASETVAQNARNVLHASMDEPTALRQVLNDTTLTHGSRSLYELATRIFQWFQKKYTR